MPGSKRFGGGVILGPSARMTEEGRGGVWREPFASVSVCRGEEGVMMASPQEVADALGPDYGAMSLGSMSHGVDPATTLAGQIGLGLALIVLVIVLVDLGMRGRMRQTSRACAAFLAAMSPLIAVLGASLGTLNTIGWSMDRPGSIADLAVVQTAFALTVGGVCTGLGLVLLLILRLDDAWRGPATGARKAS